MSLPKPGRRALLAAAPALLVSRAFGAEPLVTIDDFTFTPAILKVAPGIAVTFKNHDDEPHVVTSVANPPLFKSAALDTDESFVFTFATAGVYRYFCSLHPKMQGTIVVE